MPSTASPSSSPLLSRFENEAKAAPPTEVQLLIPKVQLTPLPIRESPSPPPNPDISHATSSPIPIPGTTSRNDEDLINPGSDVPHDWIHGKARVRFLEENTVDYFRMGKGGSWENWQRVHIEPEAKKLGRICLPKGVETCGGLGSKGSSHKWVVFNTNSADTIMGDDDDDDEAMEDDHNKKDEKEHDVDEEYDTENSFASLFRAGRALQAERERAAQRDVDIDSCWGTEDEEMHSSADSLLPDECAVESFDPVKEGYLPLKSADSAEAPADNTERRAETERHVIFKPAIKYDTSKKKKSRNGLGALNWACRMKG
jgi:hypothetical protein